MDINYRELLNPEQYEAVRSINGPVLILAGAGSGKTRVITYRIAYLLDNGVTQNSILAMTFTNKAAREMSARIRELVRKKLSNLTISTFHAFGVQVLRDHIEQLGYRKNFSIYDEQDQIELIKECGRELGMTKDSLDAYKIAGVFSGIKIKRFKWDTFTEQFQALFEEYQHHLKLYNAVDFDDLIILPIEILKKNPKILAAYHARFQNFMVDEFQDTSTMQYEFIKLLAWNSKKICIVGDDDQSIYSWRGANYENLLLFEQDFPDFKEVKLEQNYRSTKTIIDAANSLILHNKNRKDKNLWTGTREGEQIQLHIVENEKKEGEMIADSIKSLRIREGLQYSDFGILVRTNSLTRSIEEALLRANVPYRVSGGMSFFERKEVKDILSYLRIIVNPDDDVHLLRIINVPRRGFGKKTLEHIMEVVKKSNCSIYSAISLIVHGTESDMAQKVIDELKDFLNIFEYYKELFMTGRKMADTLRGLIDHINYWEFLVQEHKKQNVARWKYMNVEGLVNSLADFESDLFSYLNRISLITRDNQENEEIEKVNLMTIHSAKGLEFNVVFIACVESTIIPHQKSTMENEANIEEERRLFYVAITRARKILYMTSCTQRRKMGKIAECTLSPFIDELPKNLINITRDNAIAEDDVANEYFDKIRQRLSK
jgi:DNA helicase-2/ATP-dependent DNA helicase PcrA